jgi:response regulator RpfG family c-di-GMP phosphodiesterase
MPEMNGWEFLQEYDLLDKELQSPVIIMLTTSENPDDIKKTKSWSFVSEYVTKPLTKDLIKDVIDKYFIN